MPGRIATALIGASLITIAGGQSLLAREVPQASTAEPARSRAAAIVARMTLDEKIALLHGLFPPKAAGKTPNELIQAAGHIDGIPRLGIPLVRESDASLGVANQVEQRKGDTATALPSSLATAASFDPEIARAGGAMIGAEARSSGFNVILAGGVNLVREPRNGRNFEYTGEDPLLAGTMAGALIAGIQSNHIISTVKHFAVNDQETLRTSLDVTISAEAMRESDLLAFEIAMEKGEPGSVMCSYNLINGRWGCENDYLLNKVLKHDWGFKGFVMSDWGAVHSTADAANDGLDQFTGFCCATDKPWFGPPAVKATTWSSGSCGLCSRRGRSTCR
jgi:beta-glucosidase